MNNGINVNLNHWPAMDLIQIFKVHKKYDSVVWTSSMCPYICLQSESVFSFETLLWISRKLYSYVFAQPSWILSHSLSRICTWVACCGALFRPLAVLLQWYCYWTFALLWPRPAWTNWAIFVVDSDFLMENSKQAMDNPERMRRGKCSLATIYISLS